MKYRIRHKTTYTYKQPVSLGTHVACLTPRSTAEHIREWSEIRVEPQPVTRGERIDYFGNCLSFFAIEEPHTELVVESRSEVTVTEHSANWQYAGLPWEQVVKRLRQEQSPETLHAYQFVFESPRILRDRELADYARQSFTAGRPLDESLRDLTRRIHKDFTFDAKATTVRTATKEVFRKRRGVCQDFAHLQIACLRSLELAACYVSGYLRTFPPPGRPRLVGADASHAWVSAYCPGAGWLSVDPTNDVVPTDGHVVVGIGRDYGDVSPLRGLILGGRDHTLEVAVDMEPLLDEAPY